MKDFKTKPDIQSDPPVSVPGFKRMPPRFKRIVFACLILCMLFASGCKEARIPPQDPIKYSILGTWTIHRSLGHTMMEDEAVCTFTGTIEEGTVSYDKGEPGTYTVGGEHGTSVKFSFSYYDDGGVKITEYYKGDITDENNMSGLYSQRQEGEPQVGNNHWAAERM